MNDLGQLRRVDPSVLGDDPFWAVVRRRHPDAAVILAAPAPGPTPREPAGPARPAADPELPRAALDALAAALVAAWRTLAPVVATAGAGDVGVTPTVSWRARPGGHALVAQKAVCGIGVDRGLAVLREVARAVGGAGWLLRPSGREGVAVLDASGPVVDLRGESGAGATVLTLATRVVVVGADDRDRLLGEVDPWL